MADIGRSRKTSTKFLTAVGWLAAALGVGVYWALAETLLHRGLFATGFYYNRSFAYALNGRIVFYCLVSCLLLALFALGLALTRRFRKKVPARAAIGPRALLSVIAVATWVNLDIVTMYILYERLGLTVKQGLALPALVGGPALLVTVAIFFGLNRAWRRLSGKSALKVAARFLLAAGVGVGAVSFSIKYIRSWTRPVPAELPDVVFITLDAWRADALNSEFSPEILAFAERNGIIFGLARSTAPSTLQSFAGAMTGSYNVTRANSMEYKENLRTSWAQVMWERGYDTYAVVGNPYLDTVRLLSRGFAHYDYADFNSLLAAVHFYDTAWYFAIRGRTFKPEIPGTTSRRLTEKTLAVLRKETRRPKFVWVHYLDPHYPYQPTVDIIRRDAPDLLEKMNYGTDRSKLDAKNVRTIKALYEYEVKTTDGYVARLLSELTANPDVLVIISSDHGEEFVEHGMFEHRKTLYDEVIRVPLIISLPEKDRSLSKARHIPSPISLTDVAPSTLMYLGITAPRTMEGRTDIITGRVRENREVFAALWHPDGYFLATLVRGNKKIIHTIRGGKTTSEYFDLARDPGEQNPLPLDAEGENLDANLTTWISTHVNFSDSGIEEGELFGGRADLKALGYVQ